MSPALGLRRPMSSSSTSQPRTKRAAEPEDDRQEPLPTNGEQLQSGEKTKKKRRKKHRRDVASTSTSTSAPPSAALPSTETPSVSSSALPAVPKDCFTLFVGGLPYDVTKEQLTIFFQRDGCWVWGVKIASVKEGKFATQQRGSARATALHTTQHPVHLAHLIPPSHPWLLCTRPCRFAHVEMENEEQVARTLLRSGELWLDGEHRITLDLAKPKAQNDSKG